MTLLQAIVCIDKDYCRKIAISVEFGDGSRSEVFKFSPNEINAIFKRISPVSRVRAFFDQRQRKYRRCLCTEPITIRKQIAEGVWGEPIYV